MISSKLTKRLKTVILYIPVPFIYDFISHLLSFLLFLPLKHQKQKNVLSMCCEGGHSSILCLCSHLKFVLLLHVLCWGTALSYLTHVVFLLFLLPPLKYKKIQKNVQPDVCRGGGHDSLLFSSFVCASSSPCVM